MKHEEVMTPNKVCARCGREITWRKKWAGVFEEVRYCSDACRRKKLSKVDEELKRAIMALLSERARDATICPSEAARRVGGGAASVRSNTLAGAGV